VKRKKKGFTLVELLTVLAIIALLTGLLIPAMNMVRRVARETKQKAQLTTIALGLTAFKNDYGDYPPSDCPATGPVGTRYGGAQKLAEALLGWDLMGFHPDSAWRANGRDVSDSFFVYDAADVANLEERKSHYIELQTANAFALKDLFAATEGTVKGDTFVLCDAFGVKKLKVAGKMVKAGTPILYYRANTSSKTIDYTSYAYSELIYNYEDNIDLIGLGTVADNGVLHENFDEDTEFYDFDSEGGIKDSKITNDWPHRPDSYILISAGENGLYGDKDDIRNFGD